MSELSDEDRKLLAIAEALWRSQPPLVCPHCGSLLPSGSAQPDVTPTEEERT